jgi:hypothetical protein
MQDGSGIVRMAVVIITSDILVLFINYDAKFICYTLNRHVNPNDGKIRIGKGIGFVYII